jgi:hypothetical protein
MLHDLLLARLHHKLLLLGLLGLKLLLPLLLLLRLLPLLLRLLPLRLLLLPLMWRRPLGLLDLLKALRLRLRRRGLGR